MTHGSFIPKLMVVAFAACAGLQAESITVSSFSVTADVGSYIWSYNMSVSDGGTVETGDYFVMLDWAGYVSNTAQGPASGGWTFSYGGGTPCPPLQSCAGDNPLVDNAMWTYSGPSLGPGMPLGSFSMTSIYGPKSSGVLVAQDHSSLTEEPQGNSQSIPVPKVTSVPESSGVFELGFYASLGGAIALLIQRRRAALSSR